MSIYDHKGAFCVIFYFSFFLAAILEDILVTVFKIGGHFEKMLITLKIWKNKFELIDYKNAMLIK